MICVILLLISLFISYKEYKKENRLVNVLSIFSLGFLLPFSISFLKLSKLSDEYDIRTIVLVLGSYLSFYIGVKVVEKIKYEKDYKKEDKKSNKLVKKNKLIKLFNIKNIVILIGIVSFVCFIIEALTLRFIPLFSLGTPHAYSSFHIFGVHYITTLFFLMPALSIFSVDKFNLKNKNIYLVIFSFIYSIIMSLLLVSRALLIMTVVVFLITYLVYTNKKVLNKMKKTYIISSFVFLFFISLYILITYFRSHSIDYLNDIFEMKENTPIYITQPYMYLTQGFENLNYLITHNNRITFGRRTLAPLFSLLRTKVYFPLVTESPFYQIKLELTSKPIIYDLYYDFSFFGTFLIMFLLGFITKKIEIKTYKENNIYYILFFSLICYYLLFSFFQSYLSMLDVWFYLVGVYLLYLVSKCIKAK